MNQRWSAISEGVAGCRIELRGDRSFSQNHSAGIEKLCYNSFCQSNSIAKRNVSVGDRFFFVRRAIAPS